MPQKSSPIILNLPVPEYSDSNNGQWEGIQLLNLSWEPQIYSTNSSELLVNNVPQPQQIKIATCKVTLRLYHLFQGTNSSSLSVQLVANVHEMLLFKTVL